MRITSELTDPAVLQVLGERIARLRIEASLTQAELAEQAAIGKRTLERMESGRGAELVTLIRVLRALKILEGLERLVPELPPSPIAQLKLRGKQRRRVSHPREQRPAPEAVSTAPATAAAGAWAWGAQAPQSPPRAQGSRRIKRKT